MCKLIANAEIRLPARKTPFARKRIGRRPNMSEIFPQNGTDAALVSRYAEPTQAYPASEMSKTRAMLGSAVVIKTVSRAARKSEMHNAAKMAIVLGVGFDDRDE
jgi:hypothetical protein